MRRSWTKEETEYLMAKWGVIKRSAIAAHLGRTVESCKNKAIYLGLGGWVANNERLSMTDVVYLTGVTRDALYKTWYKRHNMKFRRIGEYLFVDEKELLRFMKDNPKLWDARKCQREFFQQYDWFMEKLMNDRCTNGMSLHRRPWTEDEHRTLLFLRRRGLTWAEIGEKMSRSKSSVASRYITLTDPLRYNEYRNWTEEEEQKLTEMAGEYDIEELAWMFQRTEKAVKSKLSTIRKGEQNASNVRSSDFTVV